MCIPKSGSLTFNYLACSLLCLSIFQLHVFLLYFTCNSLPYFTSPDAFKFQHFFYSCFIFFTFISFFPSHKFCLSFFIIVLHILLNCVLFKFYSRASYVLHSFLLLLFHCSLQSILYTSFSFSHFGFIFFFYFSLLLFYAE
jgi:hypothetical protein